MMMAMMELGAPIQFSFASHSRLGGGECKRVQGGGSAAHARLPAIRPENEDSFDTKPLPLIDFARLHGKFSIVHRNISPICQKRTH